jgi:HTH-type transcriptional regulator/antitoxin HigA
LCLISSPEERYLFMELRIIKTKKQYEQYLNWVDAQFNNKVKLNTPQGEKLQVALLLIKQYEDANYPIPLPDPIDAIKVKMNELGLKNKDLVGKIGSKGYVSSLLNKKKPLTLVLAKFFHQKLNILAAVLLS